MTEPDDTLVSVAVDRESALVVADSVPRRSPHPDGWRVAQILSHLAARRSALSVTLVVTDDVADTDADFWREAGVEVVFATTDLEQFVESRSFRYGLVVIAGKGVAQRAARILADTQPQATLVIDSSVIATIVRPVAPAKLFPSEERPGIATLAQIRADRDSKVLRHANEVWVRSETEASIVAGLGSSATTRIVEPSIGLPHLESALDSSTSAAIAPIMSHHEYLEPDLDAARLIHEMTKIGAIADVVPVGDREIPWDQMSPLFETASDGAWIDKIREASFMVLAREHGPTAWSHLIDAARCRLPVLAFPSAVDGIDRRSDSGITISDPDRLPHDVELAQQQLASQDPMSFGVANPDREIAEFLAESGVDPATTFDPDKLLEDWYVSAPYPKSRDMPRLRWNRTKTLPSSSGGDSPNPMISIIMPTYDSPLWALRAAIESVRSQTYDNWQLCIADDASPDPAVVEYLRTVAADDDRVNLVERDRNGGIAAATNTALIAAKGEFVAMLDHDDTIAPEALASFVELLAEHPDIDFAYSDEDKIDFDGSRSSFFGKPAWSPDLHLSYNYVCHFAIYRRSIVEAVGGLRLGLDGAQDYDLALRVSEVTDRIAHIPRCLYHWRHIEGSTSSGMGEKSGAWEAGHRAIGDALQRRGEAAVVEEGIQSNTYSVRYKLRGRPKVSVLIPTRDRVSLLDASVGSLREVASNASTEVEVIIVDNESSDPDTLDWLAHHDGPVLRYPHQFSYARMMNLAAEHADGDLLLFLNNDTTAVAENWLEAMIEQAQRPSVGAVGARLVFPDGRVQHEGIAMGVGGFAANVSASQYFSLGRQIRNCCAVTAACQMMRPETFFSVGGFEDRLRVAFNDVDLNLRIHEAGYNIVYMPHAVLEHDESASRGSLHPTVDESFARQRWGDPFSHDPYYSPVLSTKIPYLMADGSAPEKYRVADESTPWGGAA